MDIPGTISRHQSIALQFSGGKDSLAILHLMRPHWNTLTVYWLNTGDAPRETLRTMHSVKSMVPHFAEVEGNSQRIISQYGWPSDVVPITYTREARDFAGHTPPFLIQDRYACCMRSIMQPMYARMVKDGISLIIRGQRNDEIPKSPVKSGDVIGGVEYLFPIESWSEHHVRNYLTDQHVNIPMFYDAGGNSVDCLHCSAYWGHNTHVYLSANYPTEYNEREHRIALIKKAVKAEI